MEKLLLFWKNGKTQFRAVIRHCYLKGKTPKEIKDELIEDIGTSVPAIKTIYRWIHDT